MTFGTGWAFLASVSPVSLTLLAVSIAIFYYLLRDKDLPPGPVGLPFLGYWPILNDRTCHLVTQKWQKKYGDLFCFSYAGSLFINMGNIKVVRELHVAKADCFERCLDFNLLTAVYAKGLGFINGEAWRTLKKFTLQQFRDLGISTTKGNLSGPMHDTVADTIDYLKSKNGEPVNILELMKDKCNAILRNTLFGEDGITALEVTEINELYGVIMAFMTATNLLLVGTFTKYFIFPFKSGYKTALKNNKKIVAILNDVVNRRKSTFVEEHPRDFIDAFFKERNERRSKNDSTAEYFTDEALVATLEQFVGDGVSIVAAFAVAFLKFIEEHEEEQEKMFLEVVNVVGKERLPTIDDRARMTYTNALMNEILRTAEFMTMFPSQQCIKETTVQGYRIPKGSITLLNMWTCHQNPQIYEDPQIFNPSRFISEDGKLKQEQPVGFGIGRRACIGENYTMSQIFLFVTSIVQNFKLKAFQNSTGNFVDALFTGKVEVCAVPRN